MSQYALADRLATVSGKASGHRHLVARWERGQQIPRDEWRHWLSVVLQLPRPALDAAAAAATGRERRLADGAENVPVSRDPTVVPGGERQGQPALLPMLRSRALADILTITLLNHREFTMAELVKHTGRSANVIAKECTYLESVGILAGRRRGRARMVRAATGSVWIGPLTALLRITYGVPQVIAEEFRPIRGVEQVTLTGAWAEHFSGGTGPLPTTIGLLARASEQTQLAQVEDAARRVAARLNYKVTCRLVPLKLEDDTSAITVLRKRDGEPVIDAATPAPHGPLPEAEEIVTKLLDGGALVRRAATDSSHHFTLACTHLESATQLAQSFPNSAMLLLCEAAQLIGAGALARHGLQCTEGCEEAVSAALQALFGAPFSHVDALRQRAQELAIPISRDNRAALDEVRAFLPTVRSLLATAQQPAVQPRPV